MTGVVSELLCDCEWFDLWYEEDGVRVCECGHPDDEHIGGHGTCTGVYVEG
jgi:hypothetical protein